MDLAEFEMTDDMIGVLKLRNPNTLEELPGVEIDLLHIESPTYRERARERAVKRALKFNGVLGSNLLTKDEAKRQILERESIQIETAAVAVVGCRSIAFKGKTVDPAKFDEVYNLLFNAPWIYAQIQMFLNERVNFTNASAKS